jgi:hypothetical protein
MEEMSKRGWVEGVKSQIFGRLGRSKNKERGQQIGGAWGGAERQREKRGSDDEIEAKQVMVRWYGWGERQAAGRGRELVAEDFFATRRESGIRSTSRDQETVT